MLSKEYYIMKIKELIECSDEEANNTYNSAIEQGKKEKSPMKYLDIFNDYDSDGNIIINNSKEFSILSNQDARYFDTRKEVQDYIKDIESRGFKCSVFTEIHEEGWSIIPGIHWANAIGYWVIEGQYALKDDYIEE